MSEKEKMQRSAYQQRRRATIIRLAVVVAVLTAILLGVGLRYIRAGGNQYISYTEQGKAVYKAYLKDNEYYSEEYLNGSHAYVAALVEKMTVDFAYDLNLGQRAVGCSYNYGITAQLEVREKNSHMAIYNPVYELKKGDEKIATGSVVSLKDMVELDYNAYNKTAKDFIAAYNLSNVEAELVVRLTVNVAMSGGQLAQTTKRSHTTAVHIPLNEITVAPYVETPSAEADQKLLTADGRDQGLFKVLTILFAVADVLAIAVLAVYVVTTRDQHIDYARKVNRILSGYRSFIQKVNNSFNAENYQVLTVDSFPELLEIRDTLQSPVLMYENEDQTCTEFFVISTGIVYSYKICVETTGRYSKKTAVEA